MYFCVINRNTTIWSEEKTLLSIDLHDIYCAIKRVTGKQRQKANVGYTRQYQPFSLYNVMNYERALL